MCGIVGKYNYGTAELVESALIHSMCDQLIHRGPDDCGVFTQGPLGLGHRRLSILDLSELGHQPMTCSNNRYWVTFNGEIYNFPDLSKDLSAKGYRLKSRCDTEVLLYLYREYGENCLEHLRGMFAFAIWDSKEKTLFMARDRIGKKPLYYYDNGNTLVFASEIKSILEDPMVKRKSTGRHCMIILNTCMCRTRKPSTRISINWNPAIS